MLIDVQHDYEKSNVKPNIIEKVSAMLKEYGSNIFQIIKGVM